jgi:glutathione S-transferase
MSTFLVHSTPGSPFGRAVLVALEEKRLPYRLRPVAPGTFKSAAHLALHPFGRSPVLEHDGFRLYETQAILRYLDRVGAAPALTPSDPRQAARMDQVMNINDWYLFQGVTNVIAFNRVIKPRLMGLSPDEAAIAAALPKAHAVFDELARLLGERDYFAGEALSLADILLAGMDAADAEPCPSSRLARAAHGAAKPGGDDLAAACGHGHSRLSRHCRRLASLWITAGGGTPRRCGVWRATDGRRLAISPC